MRKIILLVLICLTLFSCRPQPDLQQLEEYDGSFSSLFELYWENMNRNYVFWALDSPSSEWDEVYDEYYPLFAALDLSQEAYDAKIETAFRYFFEISKELSDIHYSLYLCFPDGDYRSFAKYRYVLLNDSGYTDEEIFSAFLSDDDSLMNSTEYSENAESIARNTFGINLDSISERVFFGEVSTSGPLHDCHVLLIRDENGDIGFLAFLGIYDDVLYFSFSSFMFTEYLYSNQETKQCAEQFLDYWNTLINDEGNSLKGLIVDLRGNTGGYNNDISLLWGPLIKNDVHIMDYRFKEGMNRLDYTPWTEYFVHSSAKKDFNHPIAVITNKATASNGEISALFFKALDDFYGFDTASFGNSTSGGMGSAYMDNNMNITPDEDPYYHNGGQFLVGNNVDLYVSTQNSLGRYRNGTVLEGEGIAPDYPIERSGAADTRLKAALDWIKSR